MLIKIILMIPLVRNASWAIESSSDARSSVFALGKFQRCCMLQDHAFAVYLLFRRPACASYRSSCFLQYCNHFLLYIGIGLLFCHVEPRIRKNCTVENVLAQVFKSSSFHCGCENDIQGLPNLLRVAVVK